MVDGESSSSCTALHLNGELQFLEALPQFVFKSFEGIPISWCVPRDCSGLRDGLVLALRGFVDERLVYVGDDLERYLRGYFVKKSGEFDSDRLPVFDAVALSPVDTSVRR